MNSLLTFLEMKMKVNMSSALCQQWNSERRKIQSLDDSLSCERGFYQDEKKRIDYSEIMYPQHSACLVTAPTAPGTLGPSTLCSYTRDDELPSSELPASQRATSLLSLSATELSTFSCPPVSFVGFVATVAELPTPDLSFGSEENAISLDVSDLLTSRVAHIRGAMNYRPAVQRVHRL